MAKTPESTLRRIREWKREKRQARREAGLTSDGKQRTRIFLKDTPLAQCLWPFVDKTGVCWIWTRLIGTHGYGVVSTGEGEQECAHVLAWKLTHGDIPEGMEVCHNCPGGDNRACCNPAHLWLGTHAENMADMAAKGRSIRGRNPSAILNKEKVMEILLLAGTMPQREIAAGFGVSESDISAILCGTRWWWVDGPRGNHKRNCLTLWGETKTRHEWSKDSRCVVKIQTFWRRLYNGWDLERAMTQPAR